MKPLTKIALYASASAAGFGLILLLGLMSRKDDAAAPSPEVVPPTPEAAAPPATPAQAPPAPQPTPPAPPAADDGSAHRKRGDGAVARQDWADAADAFLKAAQAMEQLPSDHAARADLTAVRTSESFSRLLASAVERTIAQQFEDAAAMLARTEAALLTTSDAAVRSDWSDRVGSVRRFVDSQRSAKGLYDQVASGWVNAPAQPAVGPVQAALSLLARGDYPYADRALQIIRPHLTSMLNHADTLAVQGRHEDARRLRQFVAGFHTDQAWTPRAKAALGQAAPSPAAPAPAAPPLGPPVSSPPAAALPEGTQRIDPPFPVVDFVLTEDGAHLAILGSQQLLVYELAGRTELARLPVRPHPVGLVAAAGRIWVGYKESNALDLIDAPAWSRRRELLLPSGDAVSLGASLLASPPRVWVVAGPCLHEYDAVSLKVVSSTTLPQNVLFGGQTEVRPHPYGESVLLATGSGTAYAFEGGAAVGRALTTAGRPATFDGQGQYAVMASGLRDRDLKSDLATLPPFAAAAGHPALPYVLLLGYEAGDVSAVDLYRRSAIRNVASWKPLTDAFGGRPLKMLLRPSLPGVVLGCLKANQSIPIYLLPFPLKEVSAYPGYLAFASGPPSQPAAGLAWRYSVRLSAPFDARAAVSILRAPTTMTWDPAARLLAWTPTLRETGPVDFAIRAEDPQTGLQIQQEVSFKVDLRRVEGTQPSLDSRYLYNFSSMTGKPLLTVYDLETDRWASTTLGCELREWLVCADRVYALRPEAPELVSARLPRLDDLQEHPFAEGTVVHISADAQGNLYAVILEAGNAPSHSCLKVRPGRKPANMLTLPHAFAVRPTRNGDRALISGGPNGSFDLYTASAERWKESRKLGLLLNGPVAFSADGSCFLAGTKVYATATGTVLAEYAGPSAMDPAGTVMGVLEKGTMVLYRPGAKTKTRAIEPLVLGDKTIVNGDPIPLSKRGLLAVRQSGSLVLVPYRF